MSEIEKAINRLNHFVVIGKNEESNNAIALAISALREKAERGKNEPLALEQLRKMDGKPVWVEIPSDSPQWGIVFLQAEAVKLCPTGTLLFRYYGEWKAYAHEPEKDGSL